MEKTTKLKDRIKELTQSLFSRIMQLPVKTKIIAGSVAGVLLIVCIVAGIYFSGKEEVIYVETVAEVGNLTVGITETGNVTVEEEEQTFDIDISEFSSDNSGGFAWQSMGGGMGGMQGMTQMFGGEQPAVPAGN